MHDSVLEKFIARKTEAAPPADLEVVDDLGSFGWLRGIRDRAEMLELRHRDGTISAHAYAWLKKACFDPSGELTLDFSGETVRIAGRNLNAELSPGKRLFEGILRRKVPWLAEATNEIAMTASKGDVVIEELGSK
jgi:hypothetical protein